MSYELQVMHKPQTSVYVPWGYYYPVCTVVDLYAAWGKKKVKQKPSQNYGKLANKKWSISHKPVRQLKQHANWKGQRHV